MIAHEASCAQSIDTRNNPYSPLKYQRLLRGWSQQDLVNAIVKRCATDGRPEVGLNTDVISSWENGHHKPSPIYRKHLCALYHLTAEQLGLITGQGGHV